MFSIKPGPRNLPIDNPTLLSWNITDGDLNSKLNTLEYLNCITNIINSCGVLDLPLYFQTPVIT